MKGLQKDVKVPNHWGMFSAEGDRRITGYANTLVKQANESENITSMMQCVKRFFKKYLRLTRTDGFREASDTDVREQVRVFVQHVMDACNPGHYTLMADLEELLYYEAAEEEFNA